LGTCESFHVHTDDREGNAVPMLYSAKAELFRTLAHPVRIRVLELLAERDHAVHELLAQVDAEQSNLSQQLAVLRRAGLVRQTRTGGEVVYSLVVPAVRELLVAGRAVLRDRIQEEVGLGEELTRAASESPGKAATA
jgi:DNA-binding transcriptional ArsR family regulator